MAIIISVTAMSKDTVQDQVVDEMQNQAPHTTSHRFRATLKTAYMLTENSCNCLGADDMTHERKMKYCIFLYW